MKLNFYTDGGCEPNPGMGAWAVVCVRPHLEFSGIEENTTSNRMEMMAVIEAIKKGIEMQADRIRIYSDSRYVVDGFNDWMHSWRRRQWRKSSGETVLNQDIWIDLYKLRTNILIARKKIIIEWVKGHADNEFNTLADEIVRSTYSKHFSKELTY